MGTYLSTPVVEKDIEENVDLQSKRPTAWGVVDMQGWRKSMEDAHIAQTDVKPPTNVDYDHNAQIYAVFDGHGGAEVARFCQLYLIDVLTNQDEWSGGTDGTVDADVSKALVASFHALDCLIDNPARREELHILKTQKPHARERRTVVGSALVTIDKINNEHVNDEKIIDDGNAYTDVHSDSHVGQFAETDSNTIKSRRIGDANEKAVAVQDSFADNSSADTLSLFKKLLSVGLEAKNNVVNETMDDEKLAHEVENITPTRILNGRKVCNLPDHPIHAGCTAACAVIVSNTLTVANAGDSRVVLCRYDGATEAMSFDHKPTHAIEMKRISDAGGFVNQFGRVNGNLNLSRSIGDLKYKQIPGISPPQQMITAEPDVKEVVLKPDDEFIILACDGIWDCLTNEEAVKYVRDRIDTKRPADIGVELLDEIISDDPRETQGIGGDNMTIMIVDLKPGSRNYSC